MMKPLKCPSVQVARSRGPNRLAGEFRAIPKTIGGGRGGTRELKGEAGWRKYGPTLVRSKASDDGDDVMQNK